MRTVLLILILFVLSGCGKKEIHVYEDTEIAEFDLLLENIGNGRSKPYDLRNFDSCEEARIPGFICIRTKDTSGNAKTLDRVYKDLTILIGGKYSTLILLIDEDGTDSEYLAKKLFDAGFYNVHYFKSGYQRYADLKGDAFVPETGECNIC